MSFSYKGEQKCPQTPLALDLSSAGKRMQKKKKGGKGGGGDVGGLIHLDDNEPILSNKRGGSNYFKNRV